MLHVFDWLCRIQLPHKMALKAVKSSWGLFLLLSFSDSLVHLRRTLITCCVFPLGVYIFFFSILPQVKIPPLVKEDGRSGCLVKGTLCLLVVDDGKWSFSLWPLNSSDISLACSLSEPKEMILFIVLLLLHFCMWLNFIFLKSWRF